ncbi:hypothetical protein ACSBR2_033623 [Camellia fascicularis]
MMDWLRFPLRDWSRLPDDVIALIISRINTVEDLIVFSAVCQSWRSVAVKEYLIRRIQLPWLMLGENHSDETRGFFSIYTNKRYNVTLPNMSGRRCWGSRYGWLLVLEFNRQFYLFNPLTRVRLDLPPKPIFTGEFDHDDRNNRSASVPGFVRKACVFRDEPVQGTTQDQFMVVAIGNVSGNLALARPGEQNWIQVRTPFGRIESAAWCNGKLFIVLGTGTLLCCERDEFGRFEAKHFASQLENARLWDNISLVEYRGDLLLVFRYFSDENSKNWHKTKHFDVHKLDFETKEWIEMDDLGDCSLFIDADNSAMALCTLEVENCKRNCIYFVEKYWDKRSRYLGGHDMGVFNMVDGWIEPYFISDASSLYVKHSNPIWVMPSLC